MTKRINLTRRRVLAGLGATGLAASGAGLGTSAYLNDTETFEGNSLTAGTLDMKLDWTEHYYDDSHAEARVVDSLTEADIFLPAPAGLDGARSILLAYDDVDTFMEDTSIEAFPDVTPSQAEDNQPPYDGVQSMPDGMDPCDFLESADPALDSPLRTRGTVNGETTNPGDPLVMLDDVKPGDFGEVTFSFHLCDNPGYVWLQGDLVEARENGTNEPEAADPDESGPSDETSTSIENDVELLDAIQTRFWYDDYEGEGSEAGNNLLDRNSGGEVDVMLAIDTSGSISASEMSSLTAGVDEFVNAFPHDGSVQVGALTFGGGSISNFVELDDAANFAAGPVLPNQGSGNTPLPPALDIADNELHNGTNARGSAEKVLVLFSDGGPNYANKSYSSNGYSAPRNNDWTLDTSGSAPGYDGGTTGDAAVTESEQDETAAVATKVKANGTKILAIDVGEDPSADIDHGSGAQNHDIFLKYNVVSSPIQNYYRNVAIDDLQMAAMNIVASVVNAEEVFFRGSLREALDTLSDDDGVPLDGDLSTPYYELGDSPASENRECFEGNTTHHIAFQWWLPIDHANEIQSDSVTFDIGFYTEQCRHHNGTTAEV